ncbi:MAG: hypothetical protein EHM59_20980 [Betaproteobacteria bacterium]|nr:MAG: hypothetical protein EHM59_20980 [Betaproteobacteria bacterium]
MEPELRRAVPGPVTAFAARLAARAGTGAVAVLFYGSALRDESVDGLLDFYLLVDRARAWPGSCLATVANRVLPPNVGYAEEEIDGRLLRAKYAVMTLSQFRRATAESSLDTTLWTRFSQPCACVYARSRADLDDVLGAVCSATMTAAYWAAVLGPERGEPLAYWQALYSRTYELELRVESASRSESLLVRAPDRYARLLPAAWQAAGIAFDAESGSLHPILAPQLRARALRAWTRRRRLGRPLNVLRLLKAALTFDHALDYVVWKVERHSGVRLDIAPWQRRFPLLAAPGLYYRLRRRGLLR